MSLRGHLCLVTGATGFTGARLCRRLHALGARVRAVARATSNTALLQDVPIEWIRGEVYEAETIARAAPGVAYAFHLAAAYRTAAREDDYYVRVHVESTRRLAETLHAVEGFARFVHVSTIGVHGHIDRPPADETAPYDPGDIYQSTKADAEQWLRAYGAAHAFPYTIVRPSAIYGPGDRRLLKMFQMAARGVFLALGRRDTLYHLIHVDDLVEIICLAAVHPAALGEVFIAGNPAPQPMSRIVAIIGAALGRRVRVVRLPVAPVWGLARACEAVCRPLRIEPPLYRRRVAFYTKDRAFDTRKLRERLGYACRHTDEEGLAATALWYRREGWIR